MFSRKSGLLAVALGLLAGTASDIKIGMALKQGLDNAYRRTPNGGRPSGAARAKRIARKRKNIRARSAK